MKLHTMLVALFLGTGLVALATSALTQEKGSRGEEKGKKEGSLPPELQAWMKYASPGEHHKALEPMVGDWDTHGTFTMAPGAPPVESKGSCKRGWILGNRFLQEEVKGDFMGIQFEGFGLLGYDNMKKQYVSTWADTMMTGIMTFTGAGSDGGKKISMSGQFDDPMSGKKKTMRWITIIESNDKHRSEGFETGPDGKEFKSSDITFTRRKGGPGAG